MIDLAGAIALSCKASGSPSSTTSDYKKFTIDQLFFLNQETWWQSYASFT